MRYAMVDNDDTLIMMMTHRYLIMRYLDHDDGRR